MKTISTFLLAIFLLSMVGCGSLIDNPMDAMSDADSKIVVTDNEGVTYTIDPVSYANKLADQQIADCMTYKREQDAKKWEQVGRLVGDSLQSYLEKDQWKDAILGINGKEQCRPGTNMFDAFVSYANANGKIYEVAIAETGSTLRFGAGVLGASRIAEAIFDSVSGNVLNTNGGDIAIEDSMNEDHTTNFGDESQVYSQPDQDNSAPVFDPEVTE